MVYDTFQSGADIWRLRLDDAGKAAEKQPFIATEFDEGDPRLSPDGEYLAYQSGQSGAQEVYIEKFPKGGQRVGVSTNGGNQPVWRRDGNELFYAQGRTTMAVPIELSLVLKVGRARALFEAEASVAGRAHRCDVSADGQRFLIIQTLQEPIAGIRVVENWYEEFRDREQ